jgi:hypothetical protein
VIAGPSLGGTRQLSAWLLAPAAVLTWYPAVYGIPLFPVALALPALTLLLRPHVRIGRELRDPVRLLLIYSLLGGATFLAQAVSGVHVNRRMEMYIFGMNLVLGPLLFILAARLSPATRLRVLQAVSLMALALVFLSIVGAVGLNITSFDKQDRLTLLLVPNSIAPTSISLVLGLLFVANLAIPPERGLGSVRLALLVGLGFQIYLLSTRFVFLVVAGALGWTFLRTLRRGAIIRMLLGGMVLGLGALYVSSAGGEANTRFLSELQTFELITAPLTDTSLAIRVVQWLQAIRDIPAVPFGYGYMTFVSRNVYADPVLGWRGFNTHNEFLLQFLALGWIPPLLLVGWLLLVVRVHRRTGNLANFVPVLIGLGISGLFETFSNNPNAVNTVGLAYLVLGLTLPRSVGRSVGRTSDEVVPVEERPQGQVGEHRLLDQG